MLLLPCQPTEDVEARKKAVRTPGKSFLEAVIPLTKPDWCHGGAAKFEDSLNCEASEPKVQLKRRES
jgi:hypothetical protein